VTTADTNIVDELAAPESFLGMLQRGRGAGYLAALNAPRELVWSLLLQCITHDPRFDGLESRAEYYVSLMRATGMDFAPVYSYLEQNDNKENDYAIASDLPLEMVEVLAEQGSAEAVQMLRDYVSFGWGWRHIVLTLADLGQPAVLDGIDEVVYRRLVGDPDEHAEFRAEVEEDWQEYCDLYTEERSRYRVMLPVCEPWKTLCQRNAKLGGLFEDIGIAYHEPPPPRIRPTRESFAALSLDELFAWVDKFNYQTLWRILPERVSLQDEDFLLQNSSSDDKYRVILAFRGLGELATPRAFEAVKEFIEASENAKGLVRGRAFDVIAEMPASLTLDTARQWFRREEWHLQSAGGMILEKHATAEDIPMLIEALHAPEAIRHEDSRSHSVLPALLRFEGIGPIPELEQFFCQTPCCFDRLDAAKAMAVTAPAQFSNQYAFECLWDCWVETQELGCGTVSLSIPGSFERLRELTEDPHRYDDVRQAARKRLESA